MKSFYDIFLPSFNNVLCESLFIQQTFIEYLYLPDVVLEARDTSGSKIDTDPDLHQIYILQIDI